MVADVLGEPEIVGAVLLAEDDELELELELLPGTLILNAGSERLALPSLTLMTMLE